MRGPALYTAHEVRIGIARRLVATIEYKNTSETGIGLREGTTLASTNNVNWLAGKRFAAGRCVCGHAFKGNT